MRRGTSVVCRQACARRATVALWAAGVAASLGAQTPAPPTVDLRLFELGREAGLPSVQVHGVAEDSQGLVWFATPAGLARFDGHHVAIYGQRDGLSTQGLRSLAPDGDGGLWIGSDVGVGKRRADGVFVPVPSDAGRTTGIVQELELGLDGTLWIASARGLRRLPRHGALAPPVGLATDAFVVSLAVDEGGEVWFVTLETGLGRLGSDGRARPIPPLPPIGAARSVARAPGGGVLVAGEEGVVQLADDGSFVRLLRTDPTRRAFRTMLATDDELWLGGERGLFLYRVAGDSWRLESELLAGAAINQLVLDRSGNVWIATDNRAVYMASAARRAVHALRLPCPTQVLSLAADGDDVLVGGRCSARWRGADGRFEPLAGFESTDVWDLLRHDDGSLYAATANGLLRQPAGGRPAPVRDGPALLGRPMRALHARGARLWAAGVAGLAIMDERGARELTDTEGESLGYVYTLASDGERVFAGTLGRGLWDVTGEPAVRLRSAGLRDDSHVYAIDCHPVHGCVVIEDERLLRLRDVGVEELIPPSDGAIAGWAARFDAEGDLWVGGTSGLSRYRLPDPHPQLRISATLGLPGHEFTTSRSLLPRPGGEILCGLDDGLGRVRSAEIERIRTPPDVALLDVRWTNAELTSEAGDPPRVAYGRWNLEIALYSPWHVDLAGLRLLYRLRGLDDGWRPLDAPATPLRFSALPPGDYQLEAQATSAITGSGPVRALLAFTVESPWWLSPWYFVLGVAIVVGLGMVLWRLRSRALSRQARQLEQLIEERTESLAEANSVLERLAHHDPLTGLPNRRLLQQRAAELCAAAARGAGEFGLALVDLDHFKSINDEFGHDAGDEALRQFAQRMQGVVRAGDLLARLSGEEFVVLIRRSPTTDLAGASERFRESVAASPVPLGSDLARQLTISVGWTAWRTGDDLDALLKRADAALYRAKRTRNAVSGDGS